MEPFQAALQIGKYAVAIKFASLAPAKPKLTPKPITFDAPEVKERAQQLAQEPPKPRPNNYGNYPYGPGQDLVRDKPKEHYQSDFMNNLKYHTGGYGSMAGRAALGGLGAYALSRIAAGMFGSDDEEEEGGSFPLLSTLAGAGLGAFGVPALMAYLRTPTTTTVPTGFKGDINMPSRPAISPPGDSRAQVMQA